MANPPSDADILAAGEKAKRITRLRNEAAKERDRLIVAAVRSGRTQSEVAGLAGVTRMRVSQLMADAEPVDGGT